VIITDDRIFVGLHLFSLDRKDFEKRKVQFRTFFSPISLHPKLARGLVNISKVVPGNMVLDPFCGTGGFLIEAGIVGCRIYGSDIKTEMVEGTRKNLAQYSLFAEKLFISDIGDISQFLDEDIDVVITDAPYGKSTTTNNEDIQLLYSRAFESIRRILKPNGRIVIGLPNTTYEPLLQHYFTVEQMITLPVHRSLTRYFYIGLKKEP
jgi:tRNA (guanine10-N2)-dimethyltransferase